MSYQVTVEPTGDVIEVEEGQTLLDAALRQGIWLPFACGHGTCGTCKVQVLEGDVDLGAASPFALMDMEREEGVVLACCALPESDLVIEADIDIDPDFSGYPIEDYQAKVIAMEDLSPTIKGIRLQLDRPMQFQEGQYVNLNLPGVEGSRAFSIANSSADAGYLDLHVRLVPEGKGTSWIHESMQEGDELKISGPYGQFFVRKSDDKDVIFIVGGSGLSSAFSMIHGMLEAGDTRQIFLFQGARNLGELYKRTELEALAEQYNNFHYIPALSDILETDQWEGFCGFVHEAASSHFDGRLAGHKAYLCGPPPMIDAAITMLMQGRVFEADIHMEKFLTAADGATADSRSALFKRI